ncbi:vacuolar membrane-associated protein iml1-like isoform X2 [Bradysia coprophila]|uniref:vacuolar membrane-associated protein iml1-like isoform X2 n=1 Tax=Bradysia coprophila TaxID=38358 RepID=UPI00187DA9F6|nr:vacuolar membrane-associated protein iml1-like isoform X2 [Bradysia coprophila]
MSVILKTCIASFLLLLCVVAIRSDNANPISLSNNKLIDASANAGSPALIRKKRVLTFRPLFVYRQEQIKKIRLREDQAQNANYGSQEQYQPTDQHSANYPNTNSAPTDVHHHHHHHHHHHYPQQIDRTYESRYQ